MSRYSHIDMAEEFGRRLEQLLKDNDMTVQELAAKAEEHRNVIDHWRNGKHLPAAEKLLTIARIFGKSVDWLIGAEQYSTWAEPVLHSPDNPDDYWTVSRLFAETAQKTLWMQFRMMPRIGRLDTAISNVLKQPDGHIRLITSDPDDPCTVEMLARRRYPYAPTVEEITATIRNSIATIINFVNIERVGTGRLEIVTLPFIPSTALYLTDPAAENARVFAMTMNYGRLPGYSPYVIAEKKAHPAAFSAFYDEFQAMWKQGKKWEIRKTPEE